MPRTRTPCSSWPATPSTPRRRISPRPSRLLKELQRVAPTLDRTRWIAARVALLGARPDGLARGARRRGRAGRAGGRRADRPDLPAGAAEARPGRGGLRIDPDAILRARRRRAAGLLVDRRRRPGARLVELEAVSREVKSTLEAIDPEPGPTAAGRRSPEQVDAGFRRRIDGRRRRRPVDRPGVRRAPEPPRPARAECLEVIHEALTPEVVADASMADDVLRLRETAIKAALAEPNDPDRFDKAADHLDALIASSRPTTRGSATCSRGPSTWSAPACRPRTTGRVDARTRPVPDRGAGPPQGGRRGTSPRSPMAKALYGITLLMSGESALGRQHLLEADAEPGRSTPATSIWAAWSLLEADYPEEAERIVNQPAERPPRHDALACDSRGPSACSRPRSPASASLRATLPSPAPATSGPPPTASAVPQAVALRLVELTIAQQGPGGGPSPAGERSQGRGAGTPAVEALYVSTLVGLDRDAEAMTGRRGRPAAAIPTTPSLSPAQAALLLQADQAERGRRAAGRLPRRASRRRLRRPAPRPASCRDRLERPDEARPCSREAADKSGVSSPAASSWRCSI